MTIPTNGSPPKVSVIIPTHGHRAYIEETLASVFGQSHQHMEIIVVNDGSPDGVGDVLRPFADAKRILYVEQANQGQAAARNAGLALATGDFIAFLDDDDVWPPDKLEVQVDFLLRHPEAVGVAGPPITEWHRADAFQALPYEVMPAAWFFRGNPICSPGQTLVRVEILRRMGGFDVSVKGAEDFDLWIRIQQEGAFYFGGPLALFYRLHAQSTSKNTALMFTATSRVLEKHLSGRPLRERLQLRRVGYRFLDTYKGQEYRQLLFSILRTGQLWEFWRLLYITRAYWWSHLVDPKLMLRRLAGSGSRR